MIGAEVQVTEYPVGYRDPNHEALYGTNVQDPLIQMDMVSPSIEGYFRMPAVWIGETPQPHSVLKLNPHIHHRMVFSKKLRCGIEVRAHRDGLFLFDFSEWLLAPQVTIPGYTRPRESGYRTPPSNADAYRKAEEYAVLRAQAMNTHQACLTAAEREVKHRGAMMGFPVTAWNTEKAITFNRPNTYSEDVEDMHSLCRNIINNSLDIHRTKPLPRRLIEIEVVDYSVDLLDKILTDPDGQLMPLVESAYIAACRARDKRFGEAITLGWSVCEQLISILWRKLLDDRRENNSDGMNKDRIKKLTGRDFTASIIVETLEMMGQIDHELFRRLNIARQARNSWAHSLDTPKESQVRVCMEAVERLLLKVKGFSLPLDSGGRGGVPQWPLYMQKCIKK